MMVQQTLQPATAIHVVENHQCPHLGIECELAAFIFVDFL